MKRTIRLMTWLAVASATPIAFAETTDRATNEEASEKQMVTPTKADASATGAADEGAGGGRGELPGQQLERRDRAGDARSQEVKAIEQENEHRFQEEVWTRP